MRLIIRVLLTLLAGVVTFYFVLWPLGGILWAVAGGGETAARWTGLLAALLALVCASVMVRYVWREFALPTSPAGAGQARFIIRGAVLLGLVGFGAGFFGPLLFEPQANQGPLLGILFTGPLGVLVGAVAGDVYWRLRRKH